MQLGITATIREAPAILERAVFAASTPGDVAIDCSVTERCDAATMQILLALRAELLRQGHALHLTNVPDALVWRFQLSGLGSAIVSDPVLPEALV